MERRSFFKGAIGVPAAAALFITSNTEAKENINAQPGKHSSAFGMTYLEKIRAQYEYDLFEDYIPFHNKYVVDNETGFFYAATDHDGSHPNTNTSSTFMGRGIWCYSYLYNNISKEDKFLEIASKALGFMIKHRPTGDSYWPGGFTKDGAVIDSSPGSYAGDCYLAEGFAEFSRATGDKKYMEMAKDILFNCVKNYDDPGFTDSSTAFPGARNLWYWMMPMWFGTSALNREKDDELEKLTSRCRDAILNYHLNPKFDLMNNFINHDLSRSENPEHSGLAACGHATEATWMIMYDAVRTRNKTLFDRAAGIFRRHAIVSKDNVYGGYYNDCTDVDKNEWELTKVSWAQVFILINALYIVEHTGEQWAKDIFTEQNDWVQKHLPLKEHGYKLWLEPNDRFATYIPHAGRKDNYHHPRHLMMNLACIRRMIARKGAVSGIMG